MVLLRLRKEERPPVWRMAANIMNKQSRTADKLWSNSETMLYWLLRQAMQCTYNVTLVRLPATIVVAAKQWVLRVLRVCL
jgi:hypothetical protein